jgi:two-component system KDP operon response regulator KdpE
MPVEKPFAMGELLARMRTALRHSLASEPERVVGETLVVNVKSRLVTKNRK